MTTPPSPSAAAPPVRAFARRHALLLIVLCLIGASVEVLLVKAYLDSVRTAEAHEETGYVTTNLANLQRQVLLLALASEALEHHDNPDLADTVRLRRSLFLRQLQVTRQLSHDAPDLREALTDLEARADRVSGLVDQAASLPPHAPTRTRIADDLLDEVTTLELRLKALYDREEQRFFEVMTTALQDQRRTGQLLVGMSAFVMAVLIALAASLRRSISNEFRQAYLRLSAEAARRERLERTDADRSRVLEMIARNRPLPEVLATIARMVSEHAPGADAVIAPVQAGRFAPRGGPDAHGPLLDAIAELEPGSDAHPWGRAASRGETAVLPGGAWDAALPPGAAPEPLRSRELWTMPLHAPDPRTDPAGVLTVLLDDATPDARSEARRVVDIAVQLSALAIDHRRLADELEHQARHDHLTGLSNRLTLEQRLRERINASRRKRDAFAVLFVDLDGFKKVNDTRGHSVGDALLRQVATRLQGALRADDHVARAGGDEFVVIAAGIDGADAAHTVAAKIVEALSPPYDVRGLELSVTASVGVSLYPHDGATVEDLLRSADFAMYHAKEGGKNAIAFATPERDTALQQRYRLEEALRGALTRNEFHLAFQPILRANGHELESVEALLRWTSPAHGNVSPAEFIPLAERSDLILAIGRWVLHEACAVAAAYEGASWKIAVNISARQLRDPAFIDTVREALHASGLPPHRLQLEVTESCLLEDTRVIQEHLVQLQELGASIAIDDFGTGYSSLAYLDSFPIDVLKIDRSFVRRLGADNDDGRPGSSLVPTMIELAHNLRMRVTAEGVETREQLETLRRLGCDHLQGFLLARPGALPDAVAGVRAGTGERAGAGRDEVPGGA